MSVTLTSLGIAALLAAIAGVVLLSWRRRVSDTALRSGTVATVLSSDTGATPALILRDTALGLSGKPDYVLEAVVQNRPTLVALELKPTRRSGSVYDSDAVQVAAYTFLLRSNYGDRAAPFGYVRYASGDFRIDLTERLENRVREIVAAIRAGRHSRVVHRSHSIPARCVNCPVRGHCDESLA